MLRVFLMVILPLILPTCLYLAYMSVTHLGSDDKASEVSWWVTAPWFTLFLSGFVLIVVVLVMFMMLSGDPIAGKYNPAQFLDGRLVPGRVVPLTE